MKILLVTCMVASSSIAFAQPAAERPRRPEPELDPTTHPGFVVLDQADASSGAGFQLSYLGFDGDFSDDLTVLRAVVHGRYVSPESGIGGYFRLPVAYARASSAGMSESLTDVGDLELGGIFSPRINQPGTGVILRAGLTLPTGESGEDGRFGFIAGALTLSDLYNAVPGGTTLKLGLSPMLRSGVLFARFDLGLDWNFDAEENLVFGKLIHFGAGIGADLGATSVMVESENVTMLSDRENVDAATLSALALSARYTVNGVSPYLAVTVPIDEDLTELFDYAVTTGIEIRR